ncbi:DUF2059 domain-containing protein [Nonlabens xiamenensis]|uniref:DUF2059 domain-containing protein n=1 Tax=Nonlabens xiamenensis TaxID=2341043 RepID=UPI000F6049A0|nr:DUF2059 domain-containing protein [Nonlabens xiamenensis]
MDKIIKVILSVFLCAAFAKAQDAPSYQSLMMEYFEVSGIDEEYQIAYDGMIKMLKDGYQTQDVPESIWTAYAQQGPASIAKLKGILAAEYRSIFEDKEDLKNLIKFYKSPAGQQYRKDPSGMTSSQQADLQAFMKSNTGVKLYSRLNQINKAKQDASVYWSRELFCGVVSDLKEKGYKSGMPTGNCN